MARINFPRRGYRKSLCRCYTQWHKADVFGAMGSRNDSPPYMAHEKGMDAEYDELSAKLPKNIRLAVLYSINKWR